MIEIVIHGGVSLDLPKDFRLDIINENPLFLNDRIPSPYSAQFEIPHTANNLLAFGLPNRIAANGLKKRLPADVLYFGFVVLRGSLLLIGAEEDPKLQFVGNVMTDNIDKNLNQIDQGEYDYGSFPAINLDIDFNDDWAAVFIAQMQTAAVTGTPFAVAPMKIASADWEGEELVDGAKNSVKMYINYFNARYFSFTVNTFVDTPEWSAYIPNTRINSPILPMPYLKDIISIAFGDRLVSNPFVEGDFAKLVLPTFNHENYSADMLWGYSLTPIDNPTFFVMPLVDSYDNNGTEWRDLMFRIKSFQQAYPFVTLLKNVLKMFSMTMFSANTFSIERNDDIMDRQVIVNWDDKIAGKPIKSYESACDYVFGYGDTKPAKKKLMIGYSNMNEIYTAALVGPENVDTIMKDESTGGVYKINKIISNNEYQHKIIRCDVEQSPNCVIYDETERDKYEVTSDVKPIELKIFPIWYHDVPYQKQHWLVPEIELKGIKEAPYIMFIGDMTKVFGDLFLYPQLQAHNYDQFGVKKFDFSLHPQGPEGLVAKFHSKYKAWVEKDKLKLKVSVRLLPSELRTLNLRDKYHVGGRLFYIEKLEYSITHTNLSLVEADLIEC